MILAGLAGVTGAFLDWVSIEPPPRLPTGTDFEGQQFGERGKPEPFTGIEAGDGWVVVGGGAVLIAAGVLLIAGRRAGWLAFLATIPIGAIAIADYRAIVEPTSALADKMDLFGDVSPAIGLTLVAVSAVLGLIASVMAIAATPSRPLVVEENP